MGSPYLYLMSGLFLKRDETSGLHRSLMSAPVRKFQPAISSDLASETAAYHDLSFEASADQNWSFPTVMAALAVLFSRAGVDKVHALRHQGKGCQPSWHH